MQVIIQMHNICIPHGNLEIYAWAEDIGNTLLTAHLEFKEHFIESTDFFLSI